MSGSIPSAGNFSIGSAFQAIQGIWRDMALLKKQIPSYAEGIVTGVSPLEVTPDGSTEPVLITRTLASVKAGDRVQIRYHNNRCTLLAVVGGRDPNTIVVNGVEYARSGSTVASGGTWVDIAALPPWTYVTKTAQQPYTPPNGWHFLILPVDNFNGFIWGTQASPGSMSMRLFGSVKPATVRCDWLLIKD